MKCYYATYKEFLAEPTNMGYTIISFYSRKQRDKWVAKSQKCNPAERDYHAITAAEAYKLASRYNRRRARLGGYLADIHYNPKNQASLFYVVPTLAYKKHDVR